jgi:hypothetical protein
MNGKFIRNVLLKALGLFLLFNLILVAFSPFSGLGKLSLYNSIFPGRQRFPFGENPAQSYNLTVNDLDVLFASHQASQPKAADEFRVFVLGDSSVWGTLLHPEETLTGQLNVQALKTADGKRMVFYNLGYPTISLWKDVLILDHAMQFQPDLILWLNTLESFPGMNPSTSPFLTENIDQLNRILVKHNQPLMSVEKTSLLQKSLFSQRRSIADWYRLQLYGVLWAATGIDQTYPTDYTPAQRDFEPDFKLNKLEPTDLTPLLDLAPITVGEKIAGDVPLWIINEPILISTGKNSELRYNFFYPRWAYDQFRQIMLEQVQKQGWNYLDLWDIVPQEQFTNSAIHLTPGGEALLVQRIASELTK